MIQKDYFLRMMEVLAAAMAKVLYNKENKDYINAEKEIEDAAKTLVGLDLRLIGILNVDDVLKLMKTSDLYAGRCLVSAELLKEHSALHKIKGNETEAHGFEIKSLHLYIEAMLSKDLPKPEQYFPRVEDLISNVSQNEISDQLNLSLIDYYKFSGQFSKSENIIFELLNKKNNEIFDKAVSFYKELKSKTFEELKAGNFSIEEVNEGLNEVNSLERKLN
ncbi:MAG: DUF6483 family protein [Ignavibacteria bacterium]